jgi:hypothetical protein
VDDDPRVKFIGVIAVDRSRHVMRNSASLERDSNRRRETIDTSFGGMNGPTIAPTAAVTVAENLVVAPGAIPAELGAKACCAPTRIKVVERCGRRQDSPMTGRLS